MTLQRRFTLCCCAVAVCAALFCSCDQRSGEEPYSGGYDNASITTLTQEEGYPEVRFPVNQLVVYAEDDAGHEEVLEALNSMRGVKVIGQAPSVGFYQVEVRAASREGLDQAKTSILESDLIKGASYNILMSDRSDPGSCPTEPDVLMSFLIEHDRLPYYQTGYQTALEIMQGLRDTISLQEVTIGILEDGYARGNGQFDDITIDNYSERDSRGRRVSLDYSDSHGTAVAGIICADNDGAEVNGLASTLIGTDRLRVIMAKQKKLDFMSYCAALESLIIDGGADIINNSFGLGPFDNETAQETRDTITAFKEVMRRFSYVLFVNAAPNESVELNGRNDAPAGISLGNTLTVTTWNHDDATRRYSGAAYGDVVDIAAAGHELIILTPSGGTREDWGTSYATPQVTSAAALLKSIDPNLSPLEIKSMLLDPSFHGELTQPGGGIQLSFSAPLVDLLWEKYQNTSWGPLLLDADGDDLHDIAEIVETTICEQASLTVGDFGSFENYPEHACNSGTAMYMASDGSDWSLFVVSLFSENSDRLNLSLDTSSPQEFNLENTYSLSQDSMSINIESDRLVDDSDCTVEDPEDGDFRYQGFSDSGSYRFTRCTVSERNSDGKAKYLNVDIYYSGSADGHLMTYYPSNDIEPIDIDEMSVDFDGFVKSVRVQTLDPFGTYTQAVEEACLQKESEEE